MTELRKNRNILEDEDYPKDRQDGWHFWNYYEKSNTAENYKLRLTRLWYMVGRNADAAKEKAAQIDVFILEKAKRYGLDITLTNSKVSMHNPDRIMYDTEIKLKN